MSAENASSYLIPVDAKLPTTASSPPKAGAADELNRSVAGVHILGVLIVEAGERNLFFPEMITQEFQAIVEQPTPKTPSLPPG